MQFSLEQVYERANSYAEDVIKRSGLLYSRYSAGDIVGEFMVKFIEKGFLEKFDSTKSTFNSYVYIGLYYKAIAMVRPIKEEFVFCDKALSQKYIHKCCSELKEDFRVSDLIDSFDIITVKNVNNIKVKDKEYEFNSKSVMQLLYYGYTKKEIACLFSVNPACIYRMMSKIRKEQKNAKYTVFKD